MARKEGSLKLSSNIEPRAAAPLDARTIVPTLADLTASGAFPYPYVGMIVSVQGTGKAYILTADDTTVATNWKEIGGSSGDSVPALDTVPENPEEGDVFLYTGETTASFEKGGIYQYGKITHRALRGICNNILHYYNEQGELQSDISEWENITKVDDFHEYIVVSKNGDISYTYPGGGLSEDYPIIYRLCPIYDTYTLVVEYYEYPNINLQRRVPILDLYNVDVPFTPSSETGADGSMSLFQEDSAEIVSYDLGGQWKRIDLPTFNEDDFNVVNNEVSLKYKEWTGTHDEWDNLTSAEKAVYDGCKINFTDDDDGLDLPLGEYTTFSMNVKVTVGNTETFGNYKTIPKGTYLLVAKYETTSGTGFYSLYSLQGNAIINPRSGVHAYGQNGGYESETYLLVSDGTKQIRPFAYAYTSGTLNVTYLYTCTMVRLI